MPLDELENVFAEHQKNTKIQWKTDKKLKRVLRTNS
jgi:hypothetical protein